MIYVGIDPGKKGGIGYISPDGTFAAPYSGEDLRNVCYMISASKSPAICFVEKVHSMPKQGLASTFSFGVGYGYILGVLESFKIPYQEISPQMWKREYSLVNSDKSESIRMCKKLFPSVSLLPSERCRKDSDGMAEALLIAEYCRRRCGSKE